MSLRTLQIFFFTLLSIIISYYVAILMHEYAHATMAWIFNYKSSPFNISYGSWYLVPVSESVDYAGIMAAGHGAQSALIGISGITVTFILFLISLILLNQKSIQKNTLLVSIFFWLTEINLMEMFSYINRTFIAGDISEFTQGLAISPFWVFIPGILIVALALNRFYSYEVIKMYKLLPIKTVAARRIFLWLTFWPLLLTGIGEAPASWKLLSNTTNIVSLLIIIFILIVCDPTRSWVKQRINQWMVR